MRNVLVTGGSRGLGLAIARRLAASGDYNVVAVARRESEELGRGHPRDRQRAACTSGRSISARSDKIPAFVKELRDDFGPIYGLVNNAGIGTEGLLATMRNSEIEALIRLNVLSPIVLTKYVVRHMMADGAGRIVNISSIIASTGYSGLSVYGATKAAADRLHPLAGARSRPARHHRERDRARLHRHRNDQSPWTTTAAGVSPAAARCAACPRPTTSLPWSSISSAKAAATSPAPF